jgi:hypothetical protein
MDYKFKYKPRRIKRPFNQRLNTFVSNAALFLYGNSIFKKLKLDWNRNLRIYAKEGRIVKPKINIRESIPKNHDLEIYQITFLDCIEIEEAQKFKNCLLNIVPKYKTTVFSEPRSKLRETFEKFDSTYKTSGWGEFYYCDTSDIKALDLIDGISFGYIKGEQSHFTITYTVFPSEKFQRLFKESFLHENYDTVEIKFNFIWDILKRKRELYNSVSYTPMPIGYWTAKLFDEINFQFKTKVIQSVKVGIYARQKDASFPRICAYEYNKNEFSAYAEAIMKELRIHRWDKYRSGDTIFSFRTLDSLSSVEQSPGIGIFIPKQPEAERYTIQLENIGYLAQHYVSAIAPFWVFNSVSSFYKTKLVSLRKRVFLHITKNRITLFLRKSIKLKNDLALDWMNFERLRKDISSDQMKRQLYRLDVPNAVKDDRIQGQKPQEFKQDLLEYTNYNCIDIKSTFEELIELFGHVSENNSLKANMRLQRLLFWFAVIGILLTVYGTNSDWFNAWIEHYLHKWGLGIPTPPKKT